jgi:hypothetical protein
MLADPSLSFHLEVCQRELLLIGGKWYRKLKTINVGGDLDWPMAIQVTGADDDDNESGTNMREAGMDDDDMFQSFEDIDDELDPENTEVDDFIVDCLTNSEDRHTGDNFVEWRLSVMEIDDLEGGMCYANP